MYIIWFMIAVNLSILIYIKCSYYLVVCKIGMLTKYLHRLDEEVQVGIIINISSLYGYVL